MVIERYASLVFATVVDGNTSIVEVLGVDIEHVEQSTPKSSK